MTTAPAIRRPSSTRRFVRRILGLAAIGALVVGPYVGWQLYHRHVEDRRLRETIADLDVRDPRWRLEHLEADRAVVPDAVEEHSLMPSVHLVSDEEVTAEQVRSQSSPWMAWSYLAAGALLLAIIGTWLVWFSASLQRKFQEEDIRAACQRVMPDTAERCFDTVVIQRGGVRR